MYACIYLSWQVDSADAGQEDSCIHWVITGKVLLQWNNGNVTVHRQSCDIVSHLATGSNSSSVYNLSSTWWWCDQRVGEYNKTFSKTKSWIRGLQKLRDRFTEKLFMQSQDYGGSGKAESCEESRLVNIRWGRKTTNGEWAWGSSNQDSGKQKEKYKLFHLGHKISSMLTRWLMRQKLECRAAGAWWVCGVKVCRIETENHVQTGTVTKNECLTSILHASCSCFAIRTFQHLRQMRREKLCEGA